MPFAGKTLEEEMLLRLIEKRFEPGHADRVPAGCDRLSNLASRYNGSRSDFVRDQVSDNFTRRARAARGISDAMVANRVDVAACLRDQVVEERLDQPVDVQYSTSTMNASYLTNDPLFLVLIGLSAR